MKTIAVECPEQLHQQLEWMVREGWVKSPEQAVLEALRRFLDSHRPDLRRAQILKDVEWGLHGAE
jgi:Arc/MetJ-type ribon-helix-helix transcriptional regulator